MPRPLLKISNLFPYHVVARANNREEFKIPLKKIWGIMCNECLNLTWVYDAQIHALVLMPNHFHMIITTPKYDLGILMRNFMSSITRIHNQRTKRSGHLFGGAYYRGLIEDPLFYANAMRYVYTNPVRAKLCTRAEKYPFSTLSGKHGNSKLCFPIYYSKTQFDLVFPQILENLDTEWINQKITTEHNKDLAKRLMGKVRTTKKPSTNTGQDD